MVLLWKLLRREYFQVLNKWQWGVKEEMNMDIDMDKMPEYNVADENKTVI